MWLLNAQNYAGIRRAFPPGSRRLAVLRVACSVLSLPVYFIYPVLLLMLWRTGDPRFWRVLAVPALTFAACTVLRAVLDLPRPFDAPEFEPLVPRTDGTTGKACPSRHTASAFIIALAGVYIRPAIGLPLLALAAGIGISRVLAGVHHPRDVYAGAALAVIFAAVGFGIL